NRLLFQRLDSGANLGIRLRKLAREIGLHGFEVGARLRQRNAWLQPSDAQEPGQIAIAGEWEIRRADGPEIDVPLNEGHRPRRHTDDRVRKLLRVDPQPQSLADED